MSTAVWIVIVIAVFFLALALISMLRLLIPGHQVWKSIRWGVYVQRTPMHEEDEFSFPAQSEQPTKPYRKVQ